MQYFGDFVEDATVYIPFNTFTSDDPSASATITNLADADIKVHKDGSLTQIVTDGATVAIDFDGITGNHLITIDTSVHADYSTGSDYLVRIEGTTVDAATINAWVGSFSIQNRYMRGTDSANTTTPPTAAAISDAVWDEATTGHVTSGTFGEQLKTDVDAILVDTNSLNDTKIPQTLNLTASGNIGIDWANVENPTTALDLSGTDIQLVDTVTTVTNEVTADITKISGDATAADNLEASAETMLQATVSAGSHTTALIAASDATGYGDDTFIGRVVIFRTGTLAKEAGVVTDYTSSTGAFTFAASTWTTAPTSADTFVIV